MEVRVRVRLPKMAADALIAVLAEEVTVVILPGGTTLVPEMFGDKPVDDPVFLKAVLEALRLEVLHLEEECRKLRNPVPSPSKTASPAVTSSKRRVGRRVQP